MIPPPGIVLLASVCQAAIALEASVIVLFLFAKVYLCIKSNRPSDAPGERDFNMCLLRKSRLLNSCHSNLNSPA